LVHGHFGFLVLTGSKHLQRGAKAMSNIECPTPNIEGTVAMAPVTALAND